MQEFESRMRVREVAILCKLHPIEIVKTLHRLGYQTVQNSLSLIPEADMRALAVELNIRDEKISQLILEKRAKIENEQKKIQEQLDAEAARQRILDEERALEEKHEKAILKKLTVRQKEVVARHRIPLKLIYDASKATSKTYKKLMDRAGKQYAIGLTDSCGLPKSCPYGHDLIRDRHGHCVECGSEGEGHKHRYHTPGFVYLARGLSSNYVKVGSSKKGASQRAVNLNAEFYGATNDWKPIAKTILIENHGRLEQEVKAALSEWQVQGLRYDKDGQSRRSTEVFSCSCSHAVSVLISLAGNESVKLLE